MAGLVPAIHVFSMRAKKDVDARHKAGHDGIQCRASLLPWKYKKQPSALPRWWRATR
jgi:hypothetical protein